MYYLSVPNTYCFCLICENGPVPFKYFSFASWHDIKLSHCRRRGFCFLVLVCWLGRLPQLLSAAAQFFQFSAPSVHSSQRSPLLSTWGSSVVDASREASPSEQLSWLPRQWISGKSQREDFWQVPLGWHHPAMWATVVPSPRSTTHPKSQPLVTLIPCYS